MLLIIFFNRKNLYAEEIAHAFWDPDVEQKKDWDPMLETFEIKEKLSDAAYVAHIIFKTMVSFLVHAISLQVLYLT